MWLTHVWLQREDPRVWQKDWFCLYSAGAAFLDAGARGVYSRPCIEGYFWLYPPYMLYPYALASLLKPPLVFYGLAFAEVIVLTIVSLKFLRASLPAGESFVTIGLLVIASAAFNATVVTGQHSAILLVAVAGALWAIRADRRVVAGVFLGLLGIKPNWAAVFVVWLIVSRRWRELAGMAAVGALMVLSTLPMGLDVWREYLTAAPRSIDMWLGSGSHAYKLITFEAFARSTFGTLSPQLADVAWIVLEVFAVAACLRVWIRSDDVRDQVAVTVLAAVAANIYVEFYDALILAVPAAIWWTGRERYPRWSWKAIGVAAGMIWLWQWMSLYIPAGPKQALVGGFLAIWLAAEAVRAHPSPG